jgi:hypothetical protein
MIAFGESAVRLCRPRRQEEKVHGRNPALNYSRNGWRMGSNLSRQDFFEFIAQGDADESLSTDPMAI